MLDRTQTGFYQRVRLLTEQSCVPYANNHTASWITQLERVIASASFERYMNIRFQSAFAFEIHESEFSVHCVHSRLSLINVTRKYLKYLVRYANKQTRLLTTVSKSSAELHMSNRNF